MPTNPDDFPAALARAMTRAGLSQTQLAARTGLTRTAVNKLFRGLSRPTLATAARLADVLNVKIDELRR